MNASAFTLPDPADLYSPEERARRVAAVWAETAVAVEREMRNLPTPLEDDQLYSTASTSEILDVPARTLEAWRSKGVGPAHIKLPNGAVKYRGASLRRFIDEQEA